MPAPTTHLLCTPNQALSSCSHSHLLAVTWGRFLPGRGRWGMGWAGGSNPRERERERDALPDSRSLLGVEDPAGVNPQAGPPCFLKHGPL